MVKKFHTSSSILDSQKLIIQLIRLKLIELLEPDTNRQTPSIQTDFTQPQKVPTA